jgi:integrase
VTTRSRRSANKRRLTELYVRKARPGLTWDTQTPGLCLRVRPSGNKAWYAIYSRFGRSRWYAIGDASIPLADARRRATEVRLKVMDGLDPAADRAAERGAGTFAELHARYLEGYAKKHNKSWQQADALIRRHAIPKWGKLQASAISRGDVKQMMARIEAPIVANQTLAAVSAIFTWGIREEIVATNPCKLVARNPTQSRDRVLADSEVPQFWKALDDVDPTRAAALKMILLTGQRPGEIAHMRAEHVIDGWWTLPGAPTEVWPGTKNGESHRVWIAAPALPLIGNAASGFVFAGERGGPVTGLDGAMREVCAKLGIERATPHDLRRTHGSTITALGFGRDAMNRIQNHREGGIASVYDRHGYADENTRVMEAVAAKIMGLVEGRSAKIIPLGRR